MPTICKSTTRGPPNLDPVQGLVGARSPPMTSVVSQNQSWYAYFQHQNPSPVESGKLTKSLFVGSGDANFQCRSTAPCSFYERKRRRQDCITTIWAMHAISLTLGNRLRFPAWFQFLVLSFPFNLVIVYIGAIMPNQYWGSFHRFIWRHWRWYLIYDSHFTKRLGQH